MPVPYQYPWIDSRYLATMLFVPTSGPIGAVSSNWLLGSTDLTVDLIATVNEDDIVIATLDTSVVWGVTNVEAIRENLIRVHFIAPIYFSKWGDPLDGADRSHYAVSPVVGTIGMDGLPARNVSVCSVDLTNAGLSVDIWLDRPMSPFPSQYRVTLSGVQSELNDPLDAALNTGVTFGMRRGLPVAMKELVLGNRDFANPQTLSSLLDPLPNTTNVMQLGTFPVDESGDYARDEGLASFKKRVFRRLTTKRGAFSHMPNYGVGLLDQVKTLARGGRLDALSADCEEQIRQEPETVSVSVTPDVTHISKGVLYLNIKVKTKIGNTDFSVPISV